MSAIDAIQSKLAKLWAANSLTLFDSHGADTLSLAIFAPGIAQVLYRFYNANGRFPAVIFNDGVPASFKARLQSKPLFNAVIRWEEFFADTTVNPETGESQAVYLSTPVLNVKFLDTAGDVHNARFPNWTGADETGTYLAIGDPSGENAIVAAGAFQTWGIMLVAYSNPEFCFATDEGIALTPDGVTMLERSLPYWFEQYMKPEHWFPSQLRGPVTVGMPLELLDQLKKFVLKGRDSGIQEILGVALMFAGFYFGASAFSSLISGSITSSTVVGSLGFAKQFGIDLGTNKLAGGLKLLSLAGGDLSSLTSGSTAVDTLATKVGATMGEEDAGLGPSDYTFDSANEFVPDFSDATASLDTAVGNMVDAQDAFRATEVAAQYSSDSNVIDAQEVFRRSELSDPTVAAMANQAEAVGPVSVTQMGAITKTGAEAVSAARSVMGSSANSVRPSQSTVQQAWQRAADHEGYAGSNGDAQAASIWSDAKNLLGMYGQYQLMEVQVAKAKGSALPNSPVLPNSAVGSVSRQPDGSFSIRNPDGTITTVKPNGQTVKQTQNDFVNTMHQLASNPIVLYGTLGAVALLGIYFATKKRGR